VLTNPQVELVFWGSNWNSGSNPTLRTNVTNAVTDIIGPSPYADKLGQYGVGTGVLAGSPVTITSSSPGANFTNSQVSTMLQNNIGGSIPYNSNWLYMVITQPGSTDPTEGLGGEHAVGTASGSGNFYYGWTRNVGGANPMDDITYYFSHEYAEAVTDPDGTAWQVDPRSTTSWNEICDGEAQTYAFRVDNYLVQSYYSQADNAYVVPNGSTNNFLVSSTGVLSFQESPFGSNVIEINRVNNGVYATLNGSTAQFEPSAPGNFNLTGIQVDARAGDQISIFATGTDAPVTVNLGSGTESVAVGSTATGLGSIQGSITVNGGTGTDFLDLDDSPTSSNETYTLTASSVRRMDTMVPISFAGQSHLDLTLVGSRGADTFNVNGTESGSTTTITARTGNAAINVNATTGSLTVNLAGSGSHVNVTSISENLDFINGAIAVHGASGDSLTVNDAAKAFDSPGPLGSYSVTSTSLQRALRPAISYQSMSQVTLSTGLDVAGRTLAVDVTGTAAGTTTAVLAVGGINVIDVQDSAQTLNGLGGDLSVTGAGFTQLAVIDSGERFPAAQAVTYTATGSSVQRFGTAAVRYSAVTILDVSTGAYAGGQTFPIFVNVTGTSAVSTTVTAQGSVLPNEITVGDAAHTLAGIHGALTLNGANFSLLTADDHGSNTVGNSYTLADDSVTKSGTPAVAISYNAMLVTAVYAASAANIILVTGTAGSQAVTLDAGAGGDTVTVRATSVPLAVTFHNASNVAAVGSTTNTLSGIQGAVTLTGSLAGTALTVHDEGSSSGTTYSITSAAIGWGGPVSISYTSLTSVALNGSGHGNIINIESTAAGTTTTINAGSGGSTINLSPVAHNLANLAGLVNLDGQGGTNTLNVFDQATTYSPAPGAPDILFDNLYQDHFTRADPTEHTLFAYGGIQSVNVSAGRGQNGLEVFGIVSTPAGAPATITDASPTSQVEFFAGSPLDFFQGPLHIIGRTSNLDLILLNDAATRNPHTYTVTANTLSRTDMNGNPDMAPITYDNLIQTGLYTNNTGTHATVNVQGTAATAFTHILLLTAGDQATVNAPSVQGPLRILSNGAVPVPVSVTVDDSGDGAPHMATFSTDPTYRYLLNGLAPGRIFLDVDPGSSAQVQGGSGSNVFRMDDVPSFALSINGGTGANTLDYSAYTGNVIVDLQTGFATGIAGGLSGSFVSVHGANSAGAGLYNLLIGNGGNVLTGGTGRRNILVAGGSASTLIGGGQDDLLIGGTTSYDNDPNDAGLLNWQQIAAYWAGSDPYSTRVSNLESGNGVPLLDATTVTGNGGGNTMTGLGELALIYTDGADTISGFDPGSQQYTITP
jgi:hypothetical protein